MPIKPIKPSEVSKAKQATIPDEVIDVFNNKLVKNWTGSSAIILQSEAVDEITKALNISQKEVYTLRLLEIEDIFRKVGWCVEYDVPFYQEDELSQFIFKQKTT